MNTSEVLNKAADHIEAHGLHRGGAGIGEGPLASAPACAIGAINIVTVLAGESVSSHRALIALSKHLGSWCIPDWSDASTATEVVEVLRAAALVEAAKEVDVTVSARLETVA